jgi:hypothetical protein
LEVLGFALASGACLDFADFETGMKTSWSKANTQRGKRKRHSTRRMNVLTKN